MLNNLLILGLIDWYHWKVKIGEVNREYDSKFSISLHQKDVLVYGGTWTVNYRHPNFYLNKIYKFDLLQWGDSVSPLPKNYW